MPFVAVAPPPDASAVGLLGAADAPVPAGVPLLLVLLGVLTAYGFGFAHATLRRARKDYTVTRRSLPTLRKGLFNALTTTVGRLVIVAVVLAATVAWSAAQGDTPPR